MLILESQVNNFLLSSLNAKLTSHLMVPTAHTVRKEALSLQNSETTAAKFLQSCVSSYFDCRPAAGLDTREHNLCELIMFHRANKIRLLPVYKKC